MYYFDERLELGNTGYITATTDFVRDDFHHSLSIYTAWSEEELNAIDIFYAKDVTRQNLKWYETKLDTFTATKVAGQYEVAFDIEALSLSDQKDVLMQNVDQSCENIIYSNWSQESQSNVALALYDEIVCNQCKNDISAMLTANQDNMDAIEAAATQEELDAFEPMWPVLPV